MALSSALGDRTGPVRATHSLLHTHNGRFYGNFRRNFRGSQICHGNPVRQERAQGRRTQDPEASARAGMWAEGRTAELRVPASCVTVGRSAVARSISRYITEQPLRRPGTGTGKGRQASA